jgi:hypothetical protein
MGRHRRQANPQMAPSYRLKEPWEPLASSHRLALLRAQAQSAEAAAQPHLPAQKPAQQ